MTDEALTSRFLETADFIGAKLCRDAIWAGQRCNWFGVPVVETQRSHAIEAQSVCGSDFYSGTSGIAVFLARLFAATGENVFRMTAEAAIRQALSRLDHFPGDLRKDFNRGLTGVAYSLSEIAESCGIDKFNEMALLILEDVGRGQEANASYDPPTVTVLLLMHQRYQRDFLLRMAIECGQDIGNRNDVDVAVPMLELFKATGEKEYRKAAEEILNHQLDNKSEPTSELQTTRAYLQACEVLRNDVYAAHVRVLTESIRARIDSLTDDVDFSFPKGLAAAGDLLLEASMALADDYSRRTSERVGNWGIERYRQDDLPWPCGSKNEWDAPSFMNGLAGIGYFYLRLHDPSRVPSMIFS